MLDGDHLVIAMADPLDVYAVDDVGIAARRPVKAGVAVESEVETGIGRAYGMGAAAQAVLGDVEEEEAPAPAPAEEPEGLHDAPLARLVKRILTQALKDRAGGTHIERWDEY